jgi:hypothetical protein
VTAAAAHAEPLAAQPLPVRAVAAAAGNDSLDDVFAASPFSTMRRLDDMLQQQFDAMDAFSGGSRAGAADPFVDSFARMQQQMRDMERQLDRAFAGADAAQRQLQQQEPGVRIERREERAPGAYRCVWCVRAVRAVCALLVSAPGVAQRAHTTARCFRRRQVL